MIDFVASSIPSYLTFATGPRMSFFSSTKFDALPHYYKFVFLYLEPSRPAQFLLTNLTTHACHFSIHDVSLPDDSAVGTSPFLQ